MSKPDSQEKGSLRNLSPGELGKLSSLASISTALSRADGGFMDAVPIHALIENGSRDIIEILMHAMGSNTAGQLGSVIAGGVLLALVYGFIL